MKDVSDICPEGGSSHCFHSEDGYNEWCCWCDKHRDVVPLSAADHGPHLRLPKGWPQLVEEESLERFACLSFEEVQAALAKGRRARTAAIRSRSGLKAFHVLGFTGTREGMTKQQKNAVKNFLLNMEGDLVVHHGDCVGADAEFHDIASRNGAYIHIHPPANTKFRANCQGDAVFPPRPYLARNRDIVDDTELLLACPKEMTEQPSGGTWFTIRNAWSRGKRVYVVLPDGTFLSDEGEKK